MSGSAALPDDDLLAAELAFGLLDDAERRAALARVEADPAFAGLYARWQEHVVAMAADEDALPSPAVWDAIAARLPANDDRGLRRRLRVWQVATAASLAAALGLGAAALHRPLPAPQVVHHVTFVALLTGADGRALAVSYERGAGRLIATPGDLHLARQAAELWVIPAGGKPVSLGLLSRASITSATPSGAAVGALAAGATLAVSAEPVGGSPTGQPTGPVILTGKINAT